MSCRLCSFHIPFVAAAICVVALFVTCNVTFAHPDRAAFWRGFVALLLTVDIGVCGWVLWQSCRTGEPAELNLFGESPEMRAMWRLWRERPQLNDDEFYRTFYADSGIAKDVVIAVRREWISIFGKEAIGTYPGDNLETAAPELDFADVFYRFEKDLDVVIPWRTGNIDFDFTFDSLVRLVANCIAAKAQEE
jgi:hypothetical protein